MSNLTLNELLDNAGKDYDELPADIQAKVEAPASVSKPEGFKSRGAARSYVKANGGKVIDNGAGADVRWTVAAKSVKRPAAVKAVSVATAPVPTAIKPAAPVATSTVKPSKGDKKEVALALYTELETAGTLKRSTFLNEMSTRTGLSNKGASSYFYRIKGGKW